MFELGVLGALIALGGLTFLLIVLAMSFRTVVSTNDVHIVQSAKKTTSYGKDMPSGNVYWAWPSWVPLIGVKTIKLPVSVFPQKIDKYHAYDKDRLPFMVDIIAFFRVEDSNVAAQRVHSFEALRDQLDNILRGAIRTILANYELHAILEGRSEFGKRFTEEVDANLENWGVKTVKTIELMDIVDLPPSKVIENIMAKKKSAIEKESRIMVAQNMRDAENGEIEARQMVDMRKQEAAEQVGNRTAQAAQNVGIANEKAKQNVAEEKKTTAEKDMAVQQVNTIRLAEIEKQQAIVIAEQEREVAQLEAEGRQRATIIDAEAAQKADIARAFGEKQKTVLQSEGVLAQQQNNAKGMQAEGQARAEAARLMELATETAAQIALAKEIGQNAGYQTYLVSIAQIAASKDVGIAQAGALTKADVKIIVNAGDPVGGAKTVMDLFTAKGGQQLGAMVEGFRNTPTGAAIVEAATKTLNGATN